MRDADSGEHPTGRERRPARGRVAALTAAFAVLAAACGGAASPGLGTDTLPTTTTSTTTTTVPTVPTTTIDFTPPADESTAALSEEPTAAEIAEVVDDIRGPTESVSAQMRRLAAFIDLPTPPTVIRDLSVVAEPIEDGYRLSAAVDLWAADPPGGLVGFVEDELRSLSWNKLTDSAQTVGGVTTTELVFRVPGSSGDENELAVTIEDGPEATEMRLDYHTETADDDPSFDRLAAWQDALSTPSAATLIRSGLATADDAGTLSAVYELEADDLAAAREDMEDLVDADDFEIGTADTSGVDAPPLLLIATETGERWLIEFAATRDPEIVEMTVSTTFGLDPVS